MSELNFRLESLYVRKFRSLQDYRLEARSDFCEIFVPKEEMALDLCDFITETLYSPLPPDGELVLEISEKGKLSLLCEGGVRSVNSGALSFGEEDPGFVLTGLKEDVFRELLMNFIHEGEPMPVSPTLLDFCLKPYGAPGKLMHNIRSLDEKKLIYTTPGGKGKSDLALRRHRELTELIDADHALTGQKNELLRELELYGTKLDDNAKRSVILKADMKNYADDVKLVENRENASHLKNEIQANEKRLRLLKFEAEREVPLPQPAELFDIRQVYADFSRVSAQLCDAENQLSAMQDALSHHKKIFEHADFDADSVDRDYRHIHSNRRGRWAFLALTLALTLIAFGTFLYLFLSTQSSTLFSVLVGSSIFLGALMSFVASTMFSKKTELILDKLHIKTKKDFDQLHQRLTDHRKKEQELKGKINACQTQSRILAKVAEDQKEKLKGLLSYTGMSLDSTAKISHLCDRILTNSEAIRELEEQLKNQKSAYQRMLSADVKKETLTVSHEFVALERELDFLQRQTAALLSKKAKAEEKIAAIDRELETIEGYRTELLSVEQEIEQLSREYNSICALQKPHLKEAASLKEILTEKFREDADQLLQHIRKPGEHFALSDRLLPVMVCKGEVTAIAGDGSYLSRAAMLVYKLLLSTEYLKDCPLFFFDGFSFLDQKTVKEIVTRLLAGRYQLLSLNSPNSHSVKAYLQ